MNKLRNNPLNVLRKIDEHFGDKCRVSITVGGAVGTVPGEEWVSAYKEKPDDFCVLTFINPEDDLAQTFYITDDEWVDGDRLAGEIIGMLERIYQERL